MAEYSQCLGARTREYYSKVVRAKSSFRFWEHRTITPPAIPKPSDEEWYGYHHFKYWQNQSYPLPHKQACIACGKTHVTSEDCGKPEPRVPSRGTAEMGQNMAIGYRLARAEGMGYFNEGVYDD